MEHSGMNVRNGPRTGPARERELLLLGLLRKREMHGYQLSEFMENHLGLFFDIKKATAYNLLGKMEKKGWVTSRKEQEGKRPPRKVFAITPEGEALFQELLRGALPEYRRPAFPGNVPMLFMDALPPEELHELLDLRREAIRERMVALETHLDHIAHPLFDHQLLVLSAEQKWVEDLLKGLGE
ncbi:MAG: PadR family transcriptional regulator [Gemmatimonadetes bacterium]|nr:PadR family transcriptional regulator [Gemmatimonadota bacterium]NNM05040.1 PadR family transcriptional regulator [Gemmatimonadota bacterium]